jgi:hypothetical protein
MPLTTCNLVPGKQAESGGDRFRSRVWDASVTGWRISVRPNGEGGELCLASIGPPLTPLLGATDSQTLVVVVKAPFHLVGD